MSNKILVPLDGSSLCINALAPAEELAQQHGAEIVLLHVVPYVTTYADVEAGACPENFCTFMEPDPKSEATAAQFLTETAERLKAKGLKVSWVVLTGARPASEIVEYARAKGIDIIVLTTHGRSGWSKLWIGSVAEKVARAGSEFASIYMVRCKGD